MGVLAVSDGAHPGRIGTPPAATADVELDMFSGRPNPTWTLPAGQTTSLLGMVSGLSRTAAPARTGELGYRGMIARMLEPAPWELHAHNGIVTVNGTPYSDPGRRVERWLLETGRPFVDPWVYEIAEREF